MLTSCLVVTTRMSITVPAGSSGEISVNVDRSPWCVVTNTGPVIVEVYALGEGAPHQGISLGPGEVWKVAHVEGVRFIVRNASRQEASVRFETLPE